MAYTTDYSLFPGAFSQLALKETSVVLVVYINVNQVSQLCLLDMFALSIATEQINGCILSNEFRLKLFMLFFLFTFPLELWGEKDASIIYLRMSQFVQGSYKTFPCSF